MLSNWKVREVDVAGTVFYQVYRMTDAVRRRDFIETYGGYWDNKSDAASLAERLNRVGR